MPRKFTMANRERRKFTAEQKAEAVRLVREVGSVGQVARDLDLTESALRNWVKQADIDEGRRADGLTTAEREELVKLGVSPTRVRVVPPFVHGFDHGAAPSGPP